jgi:cytochrome b561
MSTSPQGYSKLQIWLHWVVVLLVLFQFVGNEGMGNSWEALARGGIAEAADLQWAYLHIGAGVLTLLLVVWRFYLRFARGTPALPENEPRALRFAAHAAHFLLYALLVLVPVSGAAAWFGGIEQAAAAHAVLKTVLLAVVLLHIAGALYQYFVLKSNVVERIIRADKPL